MEEFEKGLPSYGSVFALGHSAIKQLLDGFVWIEEKIDGSLFAFGNIAGTLRVRSKGQQIHIAADGTCHNKMFQEGVNTVLKIQDRLVPNTVYYGEYLQKPHHNTLCYDRVPKDHIMIYDILQFNKNLGNHFIKYEIKQDYAHGIGLECVDLLYKGEVHNFDQLKEFLDRISLLGGSKIEGMVIKNYNMYGADKQFLKGKWVSEEFKETHRTKWKTEKPAGVSGIVYNLRTTARWEKAIQHLRDTGELLGEPGDIGNLIKEVGADIEKEEYEYIKSRLYIIFKKQIMSGVIKGLPEWYKEKLAKGQFEKE